MILKKIIFIFLDNHFYKIYNNDRSYSTDNIQNLMIDNNIL